MEPRPFRFLRNLGRSRQIATVLLHHGFGDFLERVRLTRYVQWGKRILFWRRKEDPPPRKSRAVRVRLALESLGATFIKFGQVMSTRPDLLPADVVRELAKLQESVPPFPSDIALQILSDELGAPAEELYAEFDPIPIAAGSLAQVHYAVHNDGTPVAVKIRRPNVIREVERDLSLMLELAGLVERHIPESASFDPVGLVNQFARTIRREMNFTREARSIAEFSRMFRDDATLFVPAVYEDLTSDAVLTMEFIEGCRIDDAAALGATGVPIKHIATNGALIFLKQALEFGVFHGDPHPGNIRIMEDGSVCLLDYGMVGTLDDELREQMVDLFVAVARQDVRRAVELIQVLGQPWRPVDGAILRADIRDFMQNYYDLPLESIDVGRMLSDFIRILSRHCIRCPSDLMLLMRAFVTLEGVGRALDPEFNLAEHLSPFIERVLRERFHPARMASRVFQEIRTVMKAVHQTPLFAAKTLEQLSRGEFKVKIAPQGMDNMVRELDRSGNRLAIGMLLSSLVVASALIMQGGTRIDLWLSIPVFMLSSFLGVWLIYGIFRSGRL